MSGFFDFDKKAIGPTFEKKETLAASIRPRKVQDSNIITSSFGGGPSVQRYNPYTENLSEELLFQTWMPKDEPSLNALYRNIHTYDAISGSAIDLIATLPFSDFNLVGVEDPKILQIYERSVENLDMANIMPDLTVEFLTIGKVVYSLLFDPKEGVWSDMIPQDIDLCEITPIPVNGFDPKIDIKVSSEFRKFLQSPDPRDKTALDRIPDSLKAKLSRGGMLPLEPLNTLFVGRKTNPLDIGTSFLARTLPFYAIEKALIDGTLMESRRRQRAILHVTAGIEDLWEPQPEEMESIAQLFMQADEDPTGAIVVTRTGVESNEIRQGGDFWKLGDEWAWLADGKMRAMGINESFLSGDAVYSTLEIALSVFIEMIRVLRETLTARVFYRNIFQTLAKVHGFVKRTPAELNHRIRIERSVPENEDRKKYPGRNAYDDIQPGQLIMPKVQWEKQLRPEADESYLDILEKMQEVGIPVPLRTWSAAGGLDIDEIMGQLDDDKELRAKVTEWKKTSGTDEESGAWGSVKDILWNKDGNFLALNKRDMKKVLKGIQNNRNIDPMQVAAKVLKNNKEKIETAEYLLGRIGVCPYEDPDKKVLDKVAHHINTVAEENKGDKKVNRRIGWEYTAMGKMVGGNNGKGKPMKEIPTVMDRLPSSSPTLYSGVN